MSGSRFDSWSPEDLERLKDEAATRRKMGGLGCAVLKPEGKRWIREYEVDEYMAEQDAANG